MVWPWLSVSDSLEKKENDEFKFSHGDLCPERKKLWRREG